MSRPKANGTALIPGGDVDVFVVELDGGNYSVWSPRLQSWELLQDIGDGHWVSGYSETEVVFDPKNAVVTRETVDTLDDLPSPRGLLVLGSWPSN